MTNYEKYKDEMLKKLLVFMPETCLDAREKMTGKKGCAGVSCGNCRRELLAWLDEEYKEPEIDWSKVEQGTNIYNKESGCLMGVFIAEYKLKNRIVIDTSSDRCMTATLSFDKGICRLEK